MTAVLKFNDKIVNYEKIKRIKDNFYSINDNHILIYQGSVIKSDSLDNTKYIFNDYGKLYVKINNISEYIKYKKIYPDLFLTFDNLKNKVIIENENFLFPLILNYSGEFSNNKFSNNGVLKINFFEVKKKNNPNLFDNHDIQNYNLKKLNYKYSGNWLNGLQNGIGIEKCFNDEIFEGNFVEGLRDGHGVLKNKFGFIKYDNNFKWSKGKLISSGKIKDFYENGLLKYEGDFSDGNYNGKGKMYFNFENDGKQIVKYNGQFKDGKFEGEGILYYSIKEIIFFNKVYVLDKEDGVDSIISNGISKIKYQGIFKEGKYNGIGKLIYPNNKTCFYGNFYNNNLVSSKKNEECNIYYLDGHPLYKGSILNMYEIKNLKEELNYLDDIIMYKFNIFKERYNKLQFHLEILNDYVFKFLNLNFIPNGKGQFFNFSKNSVNRYCLIESGNYNYGKLEGYCKIFDFDKNKLLLEGEFKNNKVNGDCKIFEFKDNVESFLKFSGKFEDNIFKNGTIYYSKNKNKLYEGSCKWKIIKKPNNLCYLNYFNNCIFEGEGKLYYNNQNNNVEYSGNFVNSNFDGDGVLYFNNGNKCYEGEFSIGKRNGVGISFYDNGIIQYNGNWVNDNRNGEGTIFDSEGTQIITGMFENNELVNYS